MDIGKRAQETLTDCTGYVENFVERDRYSAVARQI